MIKYLKKNCFDSYFKLMILQYYQDLVKTSHIISY